jgi:hypothetical protein
MYLATPSALNGGIHPPGTLNFNMFAGDDDFSLGYLLRTWIPYAQINDKK